MTGWWAVSSLTHDVGAGSSTSVWSTRAVVEGGDRADRWGRASMGRCRCAGNGWGEGADRRGPQHRGRESTRARGWRRRQSGPTVQHEREREKRGGSGGPKGRVSGGYGLIPFIFYSEFLFHFIFSFGFKFKHAKNSK
jgi:hypothetical protein